jgi:cysteine desulfurase/selenocysteine lyase
MDMNTLLQQQNKGFDVQRIRGDFPILRETVRGRPLVYLDNAATSQKPRQVIEAISRYYERDNSNVHRGVHMLSERATREFEEARVRIGRYINAADSHEVICTRGTTEGINLVAQSYARGALKAGDEIIISHMEHHSNIVPWQMVCEEKDALLRVIPIDDSGALDMEVFENLLNPRVKLLAIVHVSNSLGTINPVKEMIRRAHDFGIPVLVDGAQAMPHLRVDVQELDADFYAFSGHKMFGPTGIGILYGKSALLEQMPPWQGGGDMIRSVTFERTTYNQLPYKFEAGTPNIADSIGLGAAVDYLSEMDWASAQAHEKDLLEYGTALLSDIRGLRLYGTAPEKASVLSFTLDGIHPHDSGTILDQEGIAVRTGHHCTQPIMDRFGIPATVRASLAFYNTREELDALTRGIRKVIELFG